MACSEEKGIAGSNGLELICKADGETAEMFLHQSIDLVCNQRGPQFKSFSHIWNIKEWVNINDAWIGAIKTWISSSVGHEEIREKLKNQGFSEEWISRIMMCLTLRKNDIKQRLISRSSNIAQLSLENFDWNVKLVMGSDKLATIREPLSEIHFELKTGHGKKNTSLELGKEELKMLIEKMEAANKVAIQLRS